MRPWVRATVALHEQRPCRFSTVPYFPPAPALLSITGGRACRRGVLLLLSGRAPSGWALPRDVAPLVAAEYLASAPLLGESRCQRSFAHPEAEARPQGQTPI